MKAFRMLCSILVIFTTALCVTTAAQNLTLRTSDVYLFYFNDSGAVNRVYTSLSNSEMADGIADFRYMKIPVTICRGFLPKRKVTT